MNRREFLATSTLAGVTGLLGPLASSCSAPLVQPSLKGPDFALAHKLWGGQFPTPGKTLRTGVVILGGGIAGLAAGRELARLGKEYRILELDTQPGGNSRSGRNARSAFPLGAHYLPLPDPTNVDLIQFLQEAGMITGFQSGLPIYDEQLLCHDPEERLFIHGTWQNGLIPHTGITTEDAAQLQQFEELVQYYREAKGIDGKWAFDIPVVNSSTDPKFLQLDNLSFGTFLRQQQLTSPYLLWYLNYCCLDDFGTTLEQTSAWGGWHYFCSRRGKAAGIAGDTVLTWPEGNGALLQHLLKANSGQISSRHLVYRVESRPKSVEVQCFDGNTDQSYTLVADHAILAVPGYVRSRIWPLAATHEFPAMIYNPWVTGNLSVSSELEEQSGKPLSWDNVIYGAESLGYVYAQHQQLSHQPKEKVITWYLPVTGMSRKQFMAQKAEDWLARCLAELQPAHPNLQAQLLDAEFWTWGHGMSAPVPGLQHFRRQTTLPNQRVHVAHSDLFGISLFEEAFAAGIDAARRCH